MKIRWSVVPLLLVGLAGFAGDCRAQTLEEALASTYRTNPTLLSERSTLRITDEQAPQALSDWRPTVEMSGDAGASAIKNNTSGATLRSQHRNPHSFSLSLSQSLYKGGQTQAAINEAENTIKAGRYRLLGVEQTVMLNAVRAYMDVFRDQAVLELNVNNEQVLKRQLEATEDRFQVGEITRTDVHQAQARLSGATADRIGAEGALEASRATYRNVIGEAPGTLARPAPPESLPASKEEAIEVAIVSSPAVVETEYTEKARRDNVEQTRGELLPSLDLSGSAKRAFQSSSEQSKVDTFETMLTLTVPIYQAGAVYSRLREAREQVGEQKQLIDQARRDAAEKADRAWDALKTAQARIDSFKTQIDASKIALEGVQREADVGQRTVLDILDAEQELLNANVSLVRAQRDETVAIFELKEAMGQLTAQHLNLPVDLYDPTSHYLRVRDKWFGGVDTGGSEGAE